MSTHGLATIVPWAHILRQRATRLGAMGAQSALTPRPRVHQAARRAPLAPTHQLSSLPHVHIALLQVKVPTTGLHNVPLAERAIFRTSALDPTWDLAP